MSSAITGAGKHVFSRTRPGHDGDYELYGKSVRVTTYRDLPAPTGPSPYHLDIADVVHPDVYKRIADNKQLCFHLNGDVGGIDFAVPQQLVAAGMEADCARTGSHPAPEFLYLVGDCVYFNGEVAKYYSQFYHPYEMYPNPIFAVAGNHDGENIEGQNSLDGFVRNFCAPEPGIHREEAQDSPQTAMVQPNVYWTLVTPVVSIVGLYSNVPEGGDIRSPQSEWLTNELATLPKELPVIVALHHPIYSADDHHSGSLEMKELLEEAAKQSGRHPDLVLAGHVHDYQRLTKALPDGTVAPYLVTGAGGYHNLHKIMQVNGERMVAPVQFTDKNNDVVTLESYVDDRYGFMRLMVDASASTITGWYYTVPRPQESYSKGSQLVDLFQYNFQTRQYIANQLCSG